VRWTREWTVRPNQIEHVSVVAISYLVRELKYDGETASPIVWLVEVTELRASARTRVCECGALAPIVDDHGPCTDCTSVLTAHRACSQAPRHGARLVSRNGSTRVPRESVPTDAVTTRLLVSSSAKGGT
jgi:hypothetical protein